MWAELVIDSLVRPRSAARRVLGLGLPFGQLVQAAIMVVSAGMVLGYVAARLSQAPLDAVSEAVLASPLIGATAQLAILALVVTMTVRLGRMFGGSGDVTGALALVVWLNLVMLIIQAVQIVLLVVMPPLATLVSIAALVWALWAFANFVTELHGFQNPMLVLGGVVLAMIVLFFLAAILLSILGFTPQGAS